MKSIKLMLFGISLMIFSGVWVIDPIASLGGAERILLFVGLIISLIGLFYREDK